MTPPRGGGKGSPRGGKGAPRGGKGAPKGGSGGRGGRPPGRSRPKPGGPKGVDPLGHMGPQATKPRTQATSGLGGEQVEGRQAVRELLLANRRDAREIWMASDLDAAPVLDDIREL